MNLNQGSIISSHVYRPYGTASLNQDDLRSVIFLIFSRREWLILNGVHDNIIRNQFESNLNVSTSNGSLISVDVLDLVSMLDDVRKFFL